MAIVTHADSLQTFWLKIFGMEDPLFEKAEMRIVVIRGTADL